MSKRHIQGTIAGHNYRSMTKDEMQYLLFNRPASIVSGTANARWTHAYVNGKYGIIILPDVFVLPSDISMTNINVDRKSDPANNYNIQQWRVLEDGGARFMTGCGAYYPQSSQYALLNSMVCIWMSSVSNGSNPDAYDQIGTANSNFTNTSYDGWIDLFSWGSSGWPGSSMTFYTPAGGFSSNNTDYYINNNAAQPMLGAYKNADWGVYNNTVIQD